MCGPRCCVVSTASPKSSHPNDHPRLPPRLPRYHRHPPPRVARLQVGRHDVPDRRPRRLHHHVGPAGAASPEEMKFVLILITISHMHMPLVVEFSSLEACEAARKSLMEQMRRPMLM